MNLHNIPITAMSGKDPLPLARTDVDAMKKPLSIDSVMAYDYPDLNRDYIFNSFYLPVSVLKDAKYDIEPIKVWEGKEAADSINQFDIEFAKSDKPVYVLEGCNYAMIAAAKHVGVSARKILATGQLVLIFKIWYGRV